MKTDTHHCDRPECPIDGIVKSLSDTNLFFQQNDWWK